MCCRAHISEKDYNPDKSAGEGESKPVAGGRTGIPHEKSGDTEKNGAPTLNTSPSSVAQRGTLGCTLKQSGDDWEGSSGTENPFINVGFGKTSREDRNDNSGCNQQQTAGGEKLKCNAWRGRRGFLKSHGRGEAKIENLNEWNEMLCFWERLFKDIYIFVVAFHVILLANHLLHQGRIGRQTAVEVAIIL